MPYPIRSGTKVNHGRSALKRLEDPKQIHDLKMTGVSRWLNRFIEVEGDQKQFSTFNYEIFSDFINPVLKLTMKNCNQVRSELEEVIPVKLLDLANLFSVD